MNGEGPTCLIADGAEKRESFHHGEGRTRLFSRKPAIQKKAAGVQDHAIDRKKGAGGEIEPFIEKGRNGTQESDIDINTDRQQKEEENRDLRKSDPLYI